MTIRVRLLLGFVLVVLLLAALIGAGSVVIGYRNGKQQAIDRLDSVAALKELQIRDWSRLVQENLALALNEEYALERASLVLKLSGDFRYSEYYFSAVRNRFTRFIGHGRPIETFSLLNLDGLEAGELGIVALDPKDVKRIRDGGQFQLSERISQGTGLTVMLNVSNSPFDDIRVRRTVLCSRFRPALTTRSSR